MKTNKVHFRARMRNIPQDFAVCNYQVKAPLTEDPKTITCKRCRKTNDYKESL